MRREILDAAYNHELLETIRQNDSEFAEIVRACCSNIDEQLQDEIATLESTSESAHLNIEISIPKDLGSQLHVLHAKASSFEDALNFADLIQSLNYHPWEKWEGGAQASFKRSAETWSFAKTDETRSTVLILSWPRHALSKIPTLLKPSPADWRAFSTSTILWPTYYLLRPLRMVSERLGLKKKDTSEYGPYLATPESLLDPIFDFAALGSEDVVADLGCGDARILIAACKKFGCRGIGIEKDKRVYDLAVERVKSAGLESRVELIHGDGVGMDLSEVTVLFLFLPVESLARILPDLKRRLPEAAKIIAHEQHRIRELLPEEHQPDESRVLVGRDAMTVGHRWHVFL